MFPFSGLNKSESILARTESIPSWSVPRISTIPSSVSGSSFITIVQPVVFCNSWITFPPGPINGPMNSLGILLVTIFGEWDLTSAFGLSIVSVILFKIWSLPSLACFNAFTKISYERPLIFISIWQAVIPSDVPVTLKSISPRWSSSPKISLKTAYLSPSEINPIAIPETGLVIWTPASIRAIVPEHTVAIEDEPLDSSTSLTTLTV